jgi:ABC-type multidrug transport system fused ATPase/permease subunit
VSRITGKADSRSSTLIRQLLMPYRLHLSAILAAMVIETVMNLAAPWPLKVIIDDVVGHGHSSPVFTRIEATLAGTQKMQLAALMALSFVLIAILAAIAGYIDNYITELRKASASGSPATSACAPITISSASLSAITTRMQQAAF